MKIYHRNTDFKFYLLWIIAGFLITGIILFIFNERFQTALLICGLLIIARTIKIYSLTIYPESISIRRYHAFGFQKSEFLIPGKDITNIKFWEQDTLDDTGATDSWLDIFFIPALFLSGKKGMTFEALTEKTTFESYKVYLNDEEYKLVRASTRIKKRN